MTSAYEKITFEEAVKIIWHNCAYNKQLLFEVMADLINNPSDPYRMVTPFWYETYKQYLTDNKKSKQ